MLRRVFAAGVVVSVMLHGCNCGRQMVTKTEASLSLPVEELDFGAVPEGTSRSGKFRIDNVGRAAVNVAIAFEPGGSADFAFAVPVTMVEPSGFVEVPIVFTPVGTGSDEAFVTIKTDKPDDAVLKLKVKGGPIFAGLAFEPDPLLFAPANMTIETRPAVIKSVGTAALNVRSVGVAGNGNPDFSVIPPNLPVSLLPGERVAVRVEYARSARTTNGVMEVLSNDPDAGTSGISRLQLVPDPPAVCNNDLDDDMDGVKDYPDDPGCQDRQDNDEYNPAVCVNGAVRGCDAGTCVGTQTCSSGAWQRCATDGGVCGVVDAGFDAGIPVSDAGCSIAGTWRIDGGPIDYQCCELFPTFYTVNLNISSFTINASMPMTMRPSPRQPGTTLLSTSAPMCPGSFTYTKTISGTCDEIFTLTGTFVSPNKFVGTYTADFQGPDCVGNAQCNGLDCTMQTWPIEAYK
jgi:hypothetical protein